MGKYRYQVKSGHESLFFMIESIELFLEYSFPVRMTSSTTRIKRFLSDYPEYNPIPRSLFKGANHFGHPITDDDTGFKAKNGHLWVRRLEDITFTEVAYVYGLRRVELSRNNGGEVIFHATGRRKPEVSINPQPMRIDSLAEYKKTDPIMDYLYVNNEFDGESPSTWRKYEILKYVSEHPYLTRKDIENLGITSNKDWDLLVDFHPGMQEINRANPKPKNQKYKILSIGPSGQYVKRQKRERRMPDVIDEGDSDSGNLKGQSFSGEFYRAIQDRQTDFFS